MVKFACILAGAMLCLAPDSTGAPFFLDVKGVPAPPEAVSPATPVDPEAHRGWEAAVVNIYSSASLFRHGLSYKVFEYAMRGYEQLKKEGRILERGILSIIDFSKPSKEKRFYTIDLNAKKLLFVTYVSHGKNTGGDEAVAFSNRMNSNQSSLGFYVTGETYYGSKGYSLRLDGMEKGFNDQMRARAVVMHDADYVSETWIKKYGRLGRSQGCPALPKEVSKEIIDTIKNQTPIFAYYNDPVYLQSSSYLRADRALFQ